MVQHNKDYLSHLSRGIAGLFLWIPLAAAEPDHSTLFLTWQEDPTSTMTIQWMEAGEVRPLAAGQTDKGVDPFAIPYRHDAGLAQVPAGAFSVDFLANNQHAVPDADDLSADAHLAWNEKGLYVWLDVRDDAAVEAEEMTYVPGSDSVELFISTGVGSPQRYQLVIAPGWDPDQPEPRLDVHDFRTEEKLGAMAAEYDVVETDQGYRVAARFLLTDLGLDAREGEELAFQFYINDRDPGTGWQWIGWYPLRDAHSNAGSMMPIRLADETSASFRARAVVEETEEGADLSVIGVPGLAEREVRIVAGDTELGTKRFQREENAARFSLSIPAAPEDGRWGRIDVLLEGEPLAQVELPDWIAGVEAPQAMDLVYYKDGEPDNKTRIEADLSKLQYWNAYYLHRVHLTGLDPDALYRFGLGDDERRYAFRTMPAELERPIRFAAGGDVRHRQEWMERTNRQAIKYDLDFIAWGGDMAYADGMRERLPYWHEFFDAIHNTLIDDDGRIIPIVVTIGNHEVQGGYISNHEGYEQTDAWRARIAPYYYQLFAFPGQPGWGVLDFGDYLSLFSLDTNHSNPIEGRQTEWLKKALAERSGRVTHLIPQYHVPAYPSVRNYEGGASRRVRETWLPLFEKYGVRAVFENHDHVYKRTHPMRGETVDPEGIIYIGDGAWGVGVRSNHPAEDTWYLARSESVRHAIIVTLEGPHLHLEVVSEDGVIVDDFRTSAP